MKILLTIDGSYHSDNAVEMFLTMAWPPDSEVRILTVAPRLHEVPGLTAINRMSEQAYRALEVDIAKVLQEAKEKISQKFGAARVTTLLKEGPPADVIVQEARTWPADMIVMGSHGTSGYNENWLGGVTTSVVNHAPCSVQVINFINTASIDMKERKKQPPEEERRFLVAVNDSPNSRAVLDEVLSRPWAPNSTFQILSVVREPKSLVHSRFFKDPEIDENHRKVYAAQKAQAEALVTDYAGKLDAKFGKGKVPHHVLEGSVRNLILQIAQDWGADMIILGAHDRDKSILEHFLGSTARAVLNNANCSVELVRTRRSS